MKSFGLISEDFRGSFMFIAMSEALIELPDKLASCFFSFVSFYLFS